MMDFDLKISSDNFLPRFIDLLSQNKTKLPPKQQKVANFILENPSFLNFATIQQVAKESEVNVATVVRFCQSLGFSGFSHLRDAIRHYFIDKTASWESLEYKEKPQEEEKIISRSLKKDFDNLKFLISTIEKQPLSQAAKQICQAKSILCIGSGENTGARLMATLLRHIGKNSDCEIRGGTFLGQSLKNKTNEDLVVSFGYYWCEQVIVKATEWASKNGIPTLVITDSIVSPLATAGETVILVPIEGVSFFQSSVTPIAIVNAIISAVTEIDREESIKSLKASRKIYQKIGLNIPSGQIEKSKNN